MIQISEELREYAKMAEIVNRAIASEDPMKGPLAMCSLNYAVMKATSKKPYYIDLYEILYSRMIEDAKRRKEQRRIKSGGLVI